MSNIKNNKNIMIAIIIGMGLILSSVIGGLFFYQAQKEEKTIKAVGIASRSFESDRAKWKVTIEEKAEPDQLAAAYQKINKQKERLLDILKDNGISIDNFNQNPINVYEQHNYITKDGVQQRVFEGYNLSQNFYIISDKVDKIEKLAYNPAPLFAEDIIIKNSNIQYFYTGIDQLKKDIISLAAANARERAAKMLEHTEVKLGKTLSLNSGIFQITEPYSTDVSSSGIHNTSTREKQIRVTVHAVYQIK